MKNFHLYSYYHNLQYQTASGSYTIPADSPNAIAVGAVDYSTPTTLESFSSRGPTQDGRIKPDLVAPDGVSTATYGASAFHGTSASAPHTAGAAALVQDRYPSYTPAQIQSFLEGRAVGLGTAGKDNLYGSGRLDLKEQTDYILNIYAEGNGITNPAVGIHTYPEDTVVNVNAAPSLGWQFDYWVGDVANANSVSTNVTMNSDKTITAVFSVLLEYDKIVFVSNHNMYTMDIDGSGKTLLLDEPEGIYNPVFSPYCNKIAYSVSVSSGGTYRICTINPDGSGKTQLTIENTDWSLSENRHPSWSPDGSKIAFSSLQSYDRIYTMNSDGSNKTRVTPNSNESNLYPSWSPDGTKIAFTCSLYGGDKDIYTINTDGSNRINITSHAGDDVEPGWSPDGSKIAFVSYRGSKPQIYIMNHDGSDVVQLTSHPSGARDPAWSIDGTKIAFWTQSDEDIYIINADGSNQIKISGDSTNDRYPSWGYIIPDTYTLTISANGSGTTIPSAGTHSYFADSTVSINATPSPGWQFVNWESSDISISSEILRPDGEGSETNIDLQYPSSGSHWDKIDDIQADDDSTYIENKNGVIWVYQRDLFSMEDHSTITEDIDKVTINTRVKIWAVSACDLQILIKTHDTLYAYEQNVTPLTEYQLGSGLSAWENISQDFYTNPFTGTSWTWEEVDNLEAGISLGGTYWSNDWSRCTQLYIEVEYTHNSVANVFSANSTIIMDDDKSVTANFAEVPTVITGCSSNITSSSAILSGNLINLGDYSSANVSFEYGTTSGNLDKATSLQKMTLTGVFNAAISSLTSNTLYYFRAKATAIDATVYGDELSFTTLTPPVVTTVSATNIGANVATLRGNLDSLGTASEINASFVWGTVSGSLTNETPVVSLSDPALLSFKLEGLTDNVTYYFKAKAVGDGTGYGSEMSYTTLTSGCFIATAAYGSYLDSHVDTLRNFRDECLMTSSLGQSFVTLYYKTSPPIAQYISEHAYLKPVVRALLMPAVLMSNIALTITLPGAAATIALLVTVTILVIMWMRRQRLKDSQHYQG